MQMYGSVVKEIVILILDNRSYIRKGDTSRLFHNISHLTRQYKPLMSGHGTYLYLKNGATDACPCKSVNDADCRLVRENRCRNTLCTEKFLKIIFAYTYSLISQLTVFVELRYRLTAYSCYLSLKRSYTGFSGILGNHGTYCRITYLELLRGESVLYYLFRDQMLLCYMHLFIFRI